MLIRTRFLIVVLSFYCFSLLQVQFADGQAQPAVTCTNGNSSCSARSALGPWADGKECKAARVFYPTTEKEIVAAVAEATKNGQKVKVVSKGAHSTPKLICPGDDGLWISTRDYNLNIVVNKTNQTATLDAGVRLKPFFDAIAKEGLAFPHSTYWAGVSISGALGTGAHGSSVWGKGGALYEYVTAMRLVVPASASEGYAKVIHLTKEDRDLNAASLSLGALGVISTVTFRLQPQFKRSIKFVQTSDANLEFDIVQNAVKNEFGDVSWFPASQTVVYREDNRVDVSTPGNGTNNFFAFGPLPITTIENSRARDESFELTRNLSGKCITGKPQLQTLLSSAFGYTNNGTTFTGYPIVGFQNDVQTFGTCDVAPFEAGVTCSWDSRINGTLLSEIGVMVPFHRIQEFIKDVKALVALKPASLCGIDLVNGLLMRFVKKSSSAYLGYPYDAVAMDINIFRNRDPHVPAVDQDIYEEIQQITTFKYGARSHLGKSPPVSYIGSHKRFLSLRKFLEVKQRYDPQGIFSNEWTDKVLNVDGANARIQTLQPFCGIQGLCICSEDIHCAPDAGYFCRSGLVYKKARVCRYDP